MLIKFLQKFSWIIDISVNFPSILYILCLLRPQQWLRVHRNDVTMANDVIIAVCAHDVTIINLWNTRHNERQSEEVKFWALFSIAQFEKKCRGLKNLMKFILCKQPIFYVCSPYKGLLPTQCFSCYLQP